MFDAANRDRLQQLFRRESRGMLQYFGESSPWVGQPDREAFAAVNVLIETEKTSWLELAKFLESSGIPLPYLGAYPTRFTAYNFSNLHKLLPVVIADHRRQLASLELDRDQLSAYAQPVIEARIEMKRKHLTELERIASTT